MKLLVCAYSCLKDPDRRFGDGGEGVLGWNIVIKAYFVAKKLHKQVHFDIFHHVTYANDWMASYIGALLPVAYVRGPGGGAHRVPKNFLQGFSLKSHILENFRSLGQWLFRHDPIFILGHSKAESILVCNNEALNAIPEKWRDKARLFPVNGISNRDLSLLGSGEKSGDKFSVITAGKLIRIKNFDLAIRTFKMFNDKFKNSELTIVGQGPRFSYLNNLVQELGLQSSVHFEKWMPREELLSKMASSDVFLFPSLRDGGGA
ncbi:MAG: glycosyltransferase, partial [Candidatus Staskawiczbacteria bacterium]|nr:glycosyltransferase [Candidatus Staskawiczbacteria bacterium]